MEERAEKTPAVGADTLRTHEALREPSRVAILDAGAQYVDLIKRACLRLGYVADILPLDVPFETIEDAYDAFLLSGGPASSHAEGAPMPDSKLWETTKGVLGICYGQQAMTQAFGGRVETGVLRQEGGITTNVDTKHPLFNRVKPAVRALFTHGDFVTEVPDGFSVIGEHTIGDDTRVISAIARDNFAAVQFHPEVFDETPFGYNIFEGFLADMCGLEPNEEMLKKQAAEDYEKRKDLIAEKAGDRHVIAFASGGVDSTVATMLAREVIDADKLHVFYFDNGFMRDEDDQVIEMLQAIGIDVQAIDATEAFEQARITLEDGTLSPTLLETTDPKIKRKIIGTKFADLKDELAAELGFDTSEVMLLQGTNAADRIESGFSLAGGKVTDQIKEHHNQVQAIKDLEAAGLLIEPLNDIHKDEIRRIGEYMNLPEEVVWRHPFPGPGNAIRILCAKPGEYEEPDAGIQEGVREYVAQHAEEGELGAWLLPTRSVGVGGDARSYVLPVALQGRVSDEILETLSQGQDSIAAQFPGFVNRVVYALGDRNLTGLSLTETTLGRAERATLRLVDRIVFEELRSEGLMRYISQFPVVLLPLSFDGEDSRSTVLRPVKTSTYMTAQALLPGRDIDWSFARSLTDRIMDEVPGISQVFWELTNKPPGTTEWE